MATSRQTAGPSKENSLIRLSARFLSLAALIALLLPASRSFAQTQVPSAPAETPTPQTPAAPAAPAPSAPPAFPKPDPANFTAASPTKDTVNAFLEANWGYDEDRMWQVQAILKTPADGVSKVVVLIGDKTGKQKPSVLEFFALPDGKHIITGDQVISFGDHPFADTRALMQQQADGPYRGSASKDLEIVEFADFQCPHCKEAQPNMDKLVADFPKAHIVFQYDPIASIHPQAVHAAEYGVCVEKLGGSSDFFAFAAAVFDGQDGLSTPDGATLTLNSAVTKAGLDPVKVAACAATPETKASVEDSVKMAAGIGVNEVPTLIVNGRQIPANIPYDMLKKVITYQAQRDGVALQ
jgi:protein-disulfide isomerase